MTAGALILSEHGVGEDIKRWGFAAVFVLAAHFGLMAGYLLLPSPQPEGSAASPAVIVELAPLPVAPASQQDLAPGPEMVEAQPTPKPPTQIEPDEVVEPTLRLETPAPAEVALPEPKPKVVEQKSEATPDIQKTEAPPVQQNTPAPQTTAAPRSEQNTAVAPQAPSPGSATSRAAIASWRDLVMARLQQNKRYPSVAESRREQGVVTLSFTVDRNGHVLKSSIVKSSGVAALDDEVLTMIKRAQPLPAFPVAMPQQSINLTVPIRFSLR